MKMARRNGRGAKERGETAHSANPKLESLEAVATRRPLRKFKRRIMKSTVGWRRNVHGRKPQHGSADLRGRGQPREAATAKQQPQQLSAEKKTAKDVAIEREAEAKVTRQVAAEAPSAVTTLRATKAPLLLCFCSASANCERWSARRPRGSDGRCSCANSNAHRRMHLP